ncbi:MAG: protein translocase subunit SecD [Anaerolineales bacterium]
MFRSPRWLIPIVIITAFALWVDWPSNPGVHIQSGGESRVNWDVSVHQGLDLQGGLQVLLEADVPESEQITAEAMDATITIIEQRVNGLGVTEPIVQAQGDRRVSIELPGVGNPAEAVDIIKETGLLEFVDVGQTPLPAGTPVQTDLRLELQTGDANVADSNAGSEQIYHTVMTGAELREVGVGRDRLGQYAINFVLNSDGSTIFAEHTAANVGAYLAIVLDGKVISSPQIQGQITGGQGQISGRFTVEEANQLALQLRYGALPVPLTVVNSRTVGPTLGQDSVRQSLTAGIIGFATVALFMLLYYRLPGFVAVLALAMYAAITFALFKLIPVTLTLPGIAGFVLSVGVAVDANILIFERMKEELRAGRRLALAVDEGFARAWPSIRDSNISTLITCTILFWFGNTFGASIVKGFALTLAIGVGVSLFTAILATRTLLHVFLDRVDFEERKALFGV